MVIEDDCIPFKEYDNFKERFIKIKNILDNKDDWDIFLGGVTYSTKNPPILEDLIEVDNEYFIKSANGYTAHMICYNEKVYDFFLNANINIPVDKVWHKYCKALIPVPIISLQNEGYSNIEGVPKSIRGRINTANNQLLNYKKNYSSKQNVLPHN